MASGMCGSSRRVPTPIIILSHGPELSLSAHIDQAKEAYSSFEDQLGAHTC